MPIFRVAFGKFTGTGNTLAMRVPEGTAANDLMVAAVLVGSGDPAVTVAPVGWTLHEQRRTEHASVYVYSKASAGESGTVSWSVASFAPLSGCILVYRGAKVVDKTTTGDGWQFNGTFSYNVPGLAPRKTTDREMVFAAVGSSDLVTALPTINVPIIVGQSEFTTLYSLFALTNNLMGAAWDRTVGVLQDTQVASLTQSVSGAGRGATVRLLLTENRPPDAPLVTMPASIDRTLDYIVNVTARDPDPNDSTLRTYIRWRRTDVTPVPAWTTWYQASPVTNVRVPGNNFPAARIELQAATRDAAGDPTSEADLKWSSSVFFLAADPPAGLSFVTPIAGTIIGASSQTFTVSVASLNNLDYRVLGDLNGSPDPNDVIVAQASLTAGDLRTFTVRGLPNSTVVHVQARPVLNLIAGAWVTSSHQVAYTPPALPPGSIVATAYALAVTSGNPAPASGQPAVSYVELERGIVQPAGSILAEGFLRALSGGTRQRLQLTPGTTYLDSTVASGVDYAYRFHAVGDNGTRSPGPWVFDFVDLAPVAAILALLDVYADHYLDEYGALRDTYLDDYLDAYGSHGSDPVTSTVERTV